MAISFRCQHCVKKVEAPDSAGGKWGRCPYCKQANYIPMPVSDDELLELAPDEDEQKGNQGAGTLTPEEQALIAEMGHTAPVTSSIPLEHRKDVKPSDIYHIVVNYCLAMADGKLEQAQMYADELENFHDVAIQAVDDFISGKAIEPALDKIPTKVLQGFLNQLRKFLA